VTQSSYHKLGMAKTSLKLQKAVWTGCKTRKELHSFVGMANHHRDMWVRRSHVLASLTALTSKTTKWKWEPQHQKAFAMAKRVIAKETLLAHPNFNKSFQIHTNASHWQLGAAVSQEGKRIAFHGRALNPAQTRHTTAERELPSTAETVKEYRNVLLGQQIVVFTDHKNPVCKHVNTERVMHWRLLLEEFGPKLTCVKGTNNIVADALSRLETAEEELFAEAFANELANEEEEFPMGCLLSCEETVFRQTKDRAIQNNFRRQPDLRSLTPSRIARASSSLRTIRFAFLSVHNTSVPNGITRRQCILVNKDLSSPQHNTAHGLGSSLCVCVCACKCCENCTASKKRDQKKGLLSPEPNPEIIPWHTLCMDLVGPCKFGDPEKSETCIELHGVTMTDPATGFFEIAEIGEKTAGMIANWLELHWLTRCPWPAEITVDKEKNSPEKSVKLSKTNMLSNGRLLPVAIHKQTP